MTLIVGIKCHDGIVLGADGAATLSVMGQTTVRQAIKKLDIIEKSIVVGVSGHVGLAQRIRGEIGTLWEAKKLAAIKPHEAMSIIREALWKHVEPELQAARVAMNVIGPGAAAESAICATMVALPISKIPCLFHFNQQCSPEEATQNLPFVSIGLGQRIADPFLAFIRRIFWPNNLPTLGEGIFAALWTLNHAISTAPGGISEPTQIVVLEKVSGNWRARELAEAEQQEHQEAISAAELSLAKFRDSFQRGEKEGRPLGPPEPTPDDSTVP